MRIGWLADDGVQFLGTNGGAELAANALLDQKPDGVEIIPCPPGNIAQDVDLYVIHNCATYAFDTIYTIRHKPVVKQVHDVWMQGDYRLRTWISQNASLMFYSSPLHLREARYAVGCPTAIIPPAMEAPQAKPHPQPLPVNGEGRTGKWVWLGRFDPGKGILDTIEWAKEEQIDIDYYGYGYHTPQVMATGRYKGMVKPSEVYGILSQYQHFVLCPIHIEPFGRAVAEAWAAGCELVINDNVGAVWWIENRPDELFKGAKMFWERVLNTR